MTETSKAAAKRDERNSSVYAAGALSTSARDDDPFYNPFDLMSCVVERGNMLRALQRVERNKGSAGTDKMPVELLRSHLKTQWPRIKEELLTGRYRPTAVRKVEIPKPAGGTRQLGIPTVLDRLIQQALHQVLGPIFDKDFSASSFGFRPGRSAHEALLQAKAHVTEGHRFVVDMDLEKFFDRVNHDILMSRLARKVKDKQVLQLIRRYLQAGVMEDGIAKASLEGTPQGGPLSPLLSNVMLDELDKELEKRGHRFCRYADDCNIYVKSKRAGERVLRSITSFLGRRLKLKVNTQKSAVDRPWKRKFLGYTLTKDKKPRLRIAPESVKRFKARLREATRRLRGSNLTRSIKESLRPRLLGWCQYFRLSEVLHPFEDLDQWLRRRLRMIKWRQAKHPSGRRKMLRRQGLAAERIAQNTGNGRGPWWNSGSSHMNAAFPKRYFDECGLVSLLGEIKRLKLVE